MAANLGETASSREAEIDEATRRLLAEQIVTSREAIEAYYDSLPPGRWRRRRRATA